MDVLRETSKAGICRIERNERALFFLWEFIASEGMQDEAREYLESREGLDAPFSLPGHECLYIERELLPLNMHA